MKVIQFIIITTEATRQLGKREWSSCSKTCGRGIRCKYIDNQAPICEYCSNNCNKIKPEIEPARSSKDDNRNSLARLKNGLFFNMEDNSYGEWLSWGPCCPKDINTATRTRSRPCIDDMKGGSKCQSYRDKEYQVEVG